MEFTVRLTTVLLLIRSQLPGLIGRLRLDSSLLHPLRRFKSRCNLRIARHAVAERLLQAMGAAASSTEFRHQNDVVVYDGSGFSPEIVHRIIRCYGLDTRSEFFNRAMENLAKDFLRWVSRLHSDDNPFLLSVDKANRVTIKTYPPVSTR